MRQKEFNTFRKKDRYFTHCRWSKFKGYPCESGKQFTNCEFTLNLNWIFLKNMKLIKNCSNQRTCTLVQPALFCCILYTLSQNHLPGIRAGTEKTRPVILVFSLIIQLLKLCEICRLWSFTGLIMRYRVSHETWQ